MWWPQYNLLGMIETTRMHNLKSSFSAVLADLWHGYLCNALRAPACAAYIMDVISSSYEIKRNQLVVTLYTLCQTVQERTMTLLFCHKDDVIIMHS